MLGTYFYHEIIRKTIVGFGTLLMKFMFVMKKEMAVP